MLRKGVPGAKCSPWCAIKEKLDELWDRTYYALKTINHTQPDGDGDFTISGDTGIVITATTNGLQISGPGFAVLDQAQTWTALQTFNSGITTDIILATDHATVRNYLALANTSGYSRVRLYGTGSGNEGSLNIQIKDLDNPNFTTAARLTNDTLTINGNTAYAPSINGDVITTHKLLQALASYVTQAGLTSQLQSYITDNELLTALSAYVDLTSAQDIPGLKTVQTEATGTYSQQIANSNKVKNELDAYAPMVRNTGNQTIAGTKDFVGYILGFLPYIKESAICPFSNSSSRTNWYKVLTINTKQYNYFEGSVYGQLNNNTCSIARFYFVYRNSSDISGGYIFNKSNNANRKINMYVTTDGSTVDIWINEAQYVQFRAFIERTMNYTAKSTPIINTGDLSTSTDPSAETGVTASLLLSTLADV